MYWRMIKNDLRRNKTITAVTAGFIAAAAMLASLAAILAVHLTGSLDTLMRKAQTPHFMQMHSEQGRNGKQMDTARLAAFAKKNKNVEKYQVLTFLNLEGAGIIIGGKSLGGSMQDNGLCVQSEEFDYLLDLDGNIIQAKDGELYIPICYKKEYEAEIGDKASICGREFRVAGFLRDSQMNSALSSSKRFLVSENDFAAARDFGETEYLIEFRLHDLSGLSAFESAYAAAGLPANGPAVTYPLFKMLNGFSDGMMIGILLLVSLLVAAIAFLCVRFTLLARMEEDYREIGVMKGIGLRISHIQQLYLTKYAAVALLGCVAGYALSLAFEGALTRNMRLFMGDSGRTALAFLWGVLSVSMVFFLILSYVMLILRRFRRIPAAEAVRFGMRQEKTKRAASFCLSENRLFSTNVFLGLTDIFARKRLYAVMLAVIVLASFIQVLPQNIYHTISAKSFMTYMGIGDCDLRIDIQQTGNISEKAGGAVAAMMEDKDISKVTLLITKMFRTTDGERIKVELGDHLLFPVAYREGRAPLLEHEIALSEINAEGLSKQTGDPITLLVDGEKKQLLVCGIYSDITNGGKTAKAAFTDHSGESMWGVICAELKDKTLIDKKAAEYGRALPFAKVSGMEEYIAQTFGQTLRAVKTASLAAAAIALLLTFLVILLFMKLLLAKDRYSIAVLKALGFTNTDIAAQYAARAAAVLTLGVVLGTILVNTIGETLAGMAVSSFGASSFQLIANPVPAYLISPLMMLGAVLMATLAGVSGAGNIHISENSKE